jgi:hypothetical protein
LRLRGNLRSIQRVSNLAGSEFRELPFQQPDERWIAIGNQLS